MPPRLLLMSLQLLGKRDSSETPRQDEGTMPEKPNDKTDHP